MILRLLALTVTALAAAPASAHAAVVKFDLNQKTVQFQAAAGEVNRLTVTQSGSVLTLSDAGAVVSADKANGCRAVGPSEVRCQLPDGPSDLKVATGDLSDEITVRSALTTKLQGDEGDDVIVGGDGVDDLQGGPGADVLEGGAGADAYDAGDGDDLLHAGDGIADTILCNLGADRAHVDAEDQVGADCEHVASTLHVPAPGGATPATGDAGTSTGTQAPASPDEQARSAGSAAGLDPAASAALTALPAPKPGTQVSGVTTSGSVLVREPGGRRFLPLTAGGDSIPVGSVIDARHGTIAVKAAKDLGGGVQVARFRGARFSVNQQRGASMVTELRLRGGDFGRCRSSRATARAAAGSRRAARVRRLWGSGHGRFTTRGRNSTATVRGTVWTVEDRCDGTLTTVERGVVAVRDLVGKRTRLVRAGQSYLARATR